MLSGIATVARQLRICNSGLIPKAFPRYLASASYSTIPTNRLLWLNYHRFGGDKQGKQPKTEHKHTKDCGHEGHEGKTTSQHLAKEVEKHKDCSHGMHTKDYLNQPKTKTKQHTHFPDCGHDPKEKTQTSKKYQSADEHDSGHKTSGKGTSDTHEQHKGEKLQQKKDQDSKTGDSKKKSSESKTGDVKKDAKEHKEEKSKQHKKDKEGKDKDHKNDDKDKQHKKPNKDKHH